MSNNSGWENEDRVYTVIRNTTKNSKVVLSTLNGIEIAPGQTIDLRHNFRKSQVVDAVHEISSLIRTGHLEDLGEGADKAPVAAKGGMPTADEMKKKMRESMIRELSDSSNMSFIEDQMQNKDPEVAAAARIRGETLLGLRDDQGTLIPGAEAETAEPTQFIRSPSTDPSVVAAQAAAAPATAPAGLVRRTLEQVQG